MLYTYRPLFRRAVTFDDIQNRGFTPQESNIYLWLPDNRTRSVNGGAVEEHGAGLNSEPRKIRAAKYDITVVFV